MAIADSPNFPRPEDTEIFCRAMELTTYADAELARHSSLLEYGMGEAKRHRVAADDLEVEFRVLSFLMRWVTRRELWPRDPPSRSGDAPAHACDQRSSPPQGH